MGACPLCGGTASDEGRCAACGQVMPSEAPTGSLEPVDLSDSPSETPTRRMSSEEIPAWEPPPRRPWLVLGLCSSAVVLAGALGWWMWS